MGFYEDIATALDSEGIESRIHDDVLFVPIAPELEIQFHQVLTSGGVSAVTAAEVFVATPEGFDPESGDAEWDVDETEDVDEEFFDAVLVGVVFSPEAALAEVVKHIATDVIVSVMNDLLDGADERVEGLEFEQDDIDPMLLVCPVAVDSELEVRLAIVDGQPQAEVLFISYGEKFHELVLQAFEELEGAKAEADRIAQDIVDEVADMTREVLELGIFTDADELFDALAVAAQKAEEWEELLTPVGEPVGKMER